MLDAIGNIVKAYFARGVTTYIYKIKHRNLLKCVIYVIKHEFEVKKKKETNFDFLQLSKLLSLMHITLWACLR